MSELVSTGVRGSAREASGLLAVADRRLLEARGWDAAFWSVLDEERVEEGIVLLGRDASGWTLELPRFAPSPVKTGDGEALARHADHVYVFGSHFGKKRLEPECAGDPRQGARGPDRERDVAGDPRG